jgi:hypothetical protein
MNAASGRRAGVMPIPGDSVEAPTWLEHLAGLDIDSVDRIVPALQDPKLGDVVSLSPDGLVR